MKRKILATMMMAFILATTACGNNDSNVNGSVNAEADAKTDATDTESKTDSTADNNETASLDTETASEEPPQDMEQQYKDMAAKFAVYCEQIYLGYEDRGTVTAGDITITEDTGTECHLTVYYNEPDIATGNMSADGGMGYMEFVIDKATSQGQMTAWNYLIGSESPDYSADQENPEVADMIGEASGYYDFPNDAVFDFKEGVILSSGSVVADVNEYFN